jgi:hypothetical protein
MPLPTTFSNPRAPRRAVQVFLVSGPREAETSNMRGRTEETSRTGRRKLRRLGGVALAVLLFPLLTVSPSRASCQKMVLTFASASDRRVLEVGPGTMGSIVGEFWTHDCFDTGGGGGACYGPGNERPIMNLGSTSSTPRSTAAQGEAARTCS